MRLWAALRLPAALVEQRDPASEGWRQSPRSHRCPGMRRRVWAVRICIVLMFSRQTVTQLWQRLPLTSSSSFHCGGQIVANLTLTHVCLPFLWAAREDVFQSPQPCQRWHHATFSPQMSSTAAGCWRGWHEKGKKKVGKHLRLQTWRRPSRVCQRGCHSLCVIGRDLMMEHVFSSVAMLNRAGVTYMNRTDIYGTSEALFKFLSQKW